MVSPLSKWLLVFLLILIPVQVVIAAEERVVTVDARLAELNKIETTLVSEKYEDSNLKSWLKELANAKVFASACMAENETLLQEYDQRLKGLGEPTTDEPKEVGEKRTLLNKEKAELEKLQARCQLLQLRSEELVNNIEKVKSELLAKKLLHREDHLLDLLVKNALNLEEWWNTSSTFVTQHSGLELLTTFEWVLLFISMPAAWLGGMWAKRFLLVLSRGLEKKEGFANEFLLALTATGASYLPMLLLSLAAPVYFLVATGSVRPIPVVNIFAYGLPLIVALLFLTRLVLSPVEPAKPFIKIEYKYGVKLRHRLQSLIIVGFVLYVVAAVMHVGQFPEYLISLTLMIMTTIMILQIILMLRLLRHSSYLSEFSWALLVVNLLLFVSQIAHLAGYVNLGNLGKRTLIGGVLLWGISLFIHKFLSSLFDSLDHGASTWSQQVRRKVGVKEGKVFPGLFLLRLMTAIIIWGGFIVLVLQLFGISSTLMADVRAFIVSGVTIGTFQIVPAKFFWALLSFSTLVIVGNWIKSRMRKRWLNLLPISSSGRDTLLTLTGYLVYTVAILIALGMMGMDYTKLALIAGALSVGIGFGLQNIVSNFISGLILLFERPIRIGDWVVVGGIEGYVRKINIRATVIETFDMAEIIVPNSEFISGQVTNWTLASMVGRVVVPVGVAYGSNTEQVQDILLDIARNHPEVVNDASAPEPSVVFREFGDSSLNFQLRCFLVNVDRRLRILSDLNFAIDKAFREAGIEIPFPQRDLHVKDWPEKPGTLPDNSGQPDKEGGA